MEKAKNLSIFGDYLRQRLIDKKMSLRTLAKKTGMDPSNLSKIERGVAYPPQKEENLQKLATALELDQESTRHFFDLAAQVNGMLPDDLDDIKQNEAIPMLLRTIQNRRLTYDQTIELTKLIAQENNWQGRVIE